MADYFYIDAISNQQCGPFSIEELKTKYIKTDTMVWCSGMTDWLAASMVPELSVVFNNSSTHIANKPTIAPPMSSRPQQGIYDNNVYGQRMQRNSEDLNDVRPIPRTWLVESILLTVFCCPPFGIAAILQASKVESLYYARDYEASEKASKDAKKWAMIGLISTGVLYVLIFLFYFIAIIASLYLGSL